MSQIMQIIDFINEYGSITALQAVNALGCCRLASRIHELKKAGIEVNREMITVTNRNGLPCRVARYSFPAGVFPKGLAHG